MSSSLGDIDLPGLVEGLSDEELDDLVTSLPPGAVNALLTQTATHGSVPPDPLAQAQELDDTIRPRPHLKYLAGRIASAVADVEAGQDRRLLVTMPPRAGKTTTTSVHTPTWTLRKHPNWPHALASHDGTLATSWGRQIRRTIEQHPALGVSLAPDAGAASEWETTEGGGVLARGTGGSFTGRGAKVLIIDDPIKDFMQAHSATSRQAVWDWWLGVAQNRLEPPTLVIVVLTRWHEDDFAGRLLSSEFEGDPEDWEVIRLPALAEEDDVLGRAPGDPLLSPLLDETPEEAKARWEKVRRAVGSYTFSSMYQQRPAPAKGAIFDTGWWRFWTTDPDRATDDGRVVLLSPSGDLNAGGAHWLDSWDCAFKGTDGSDYVVGQRWCRKGTRRYLIHQTRARLSFTQTLERMREWADPVAPLYGTSQTHERVVEDKANGTAVIDTLKEEIAGLVPVNPTESKEARARAVTPECEAGNVYLPHPADPGNEWVQDLLSELRNFPHDAHDDQVDALTQALSRLRTATGGSVHVPGRERGPVDRNVARSARSQRRITRGYQTSGRRSR